MGFNDEEKQKMRLVLESDGTEIDEEFLPFLETSTTLVLLKSSEKWEIIKCTGMYNYTVFLLCYEKSHCLTFVALIMPALFHMMSEF